MEEIERVVEQVDVGVLLLLGEEVAYLKRQRKGFFEKTEEIFLHKMYYVQVHVTL